MMHRNMGLWAAILILVGCPGTSKNSPKDAPIDEDIPVEDGSISGRVCHVSGTTWLAEALVYTHILDEDGRLTDTRTAYTDEEGQFTLEVLPGHQSYVVYIQFEGEALSKERHLVGPGEAVVLETPPCLDPRHLSLAVISGHGRVERTLAEIGVTDFETIDGTDSEALAAFLLDLPALRTHDIVIFDAGLTEAGIFYEVEDGRKPSHPESPGEHDTGAHDTGAPDTGPLDTGAAPDDTGPSDTGAAPDDTGSSDTGSSPDDTGEPVVPVYDTDLILENLRTYVSDGGTIYAIEWAYDVIELTFPEAIDFVGEDLVPDAAQVGQPGEVEATVEDAALAQWLGKDTLDVRFSLAEWPVVEATTGVVLLSGDAELDLAGGDYVQFDAPLLLSVAQGEGTLVLSAFRAGGGASSGMQAATQHMLITLQPTE